MEDNDEGLLVGLDPVSLKEGIYSIRLEANNCAIIEPGTVEYPDGTVYMGGFQRGKRHGAGRWYNPATTDEYDGEWVADKRHGMGMQRSLTAVMGAAATTASREMTTSVYKGEWVNDVRDGHGAETFGDGSSYEGNYVRDVMQGPGTLRYANGDVYEGEFQQSQPHGKGRLTYASGDTLEGNFKGGKRHGNSVAFYAGSGKRFLCVWVDDNLEGVPTPVTL